MQTEQLIRNLRRPTGPIDVVLDTDAYNEIDDQFAIAYLLKSPEKLRVQALCAAPFYNIHSTGPADGMQRSYDEILHLLALMGREDLNDRVFAGSTGYLPNETTPVVSPAAETIASLAMAHTPEEPLYVAAIGAVTNVASALLLQPAAAERMVLVWLGGHARHWHDNREFNLHQDIAAARVVFGCGVPLVQLPCNGVVSELRTTGPELAFWLKGKNPLCDYLYTHTCEEAESYAAGKPWSRVIWDVSTIAWLLDADEQMVHAYLLPAAIPSYDGHYAYDDRRHPMLYVYSVNRDAIFNDLFTRLSR